MPETNHPDSENLSLLAPTWAPSAHGYRVFQRREPIGTGLAWDEAARRLLTWGVKTASGFRVDSSDPVRSGDRQSVRAWVIREPVEVTEVVEEPDRVAFSYRTLPGHPVRGEEAFILTREDGVAALTIRSLTAPSKSMPWRLAFPVLRVVQRLVRRRYFRALR
ncbi:DUF1990 family protein [Galactobacter sp.]|uniref:DUF1990 family protein n=1 Tax=Galactobacter sp. TaxID=2676125 RepID=UPI0025BF2A0A|nr:DUF1990 family protein [Galactobacter sp.]